MYKKSIFIIVSLLVVVVVNGYPDKTGLPLRFTSLSIENGLSQSTVYDIAQDKEGNIWVATADGLNKYDGYTFIVFRHQENNKGIQSDLTRSLFVDNEDNLWIGTSRGISQYDSKKGIFKPYIINAQINDIIQLADSTLCLATSNGLYAFDKKSNKYISIPIDGQKNKFCQTLVKYNGLLLVGTTSGLYMSIAGKTNMALFRQELFDKNIMDIIPCEKGLWIATEGNGLYFISSNGQIKNYRHNKDDKRSLTSDYIRTLCFDDRQQLWIGTFVGLNIYDESSDSFNRYYSNEIERGSINQNSVRSLFLDNQNGMWVGTFFGGINYHHPLQCQFGRICHIPYRNSLNDNIVSCIVKGNANELWIGTNENGLNVYDLNTKLFIHYVADANKKNSILSNNIKAVLPDNNKIYIGSHGGGLAILNRSKNQILNYTTSNSGILCNDVYALAKVPNNKIWLGTLKGISVLDPIRNTIVPLEKENLDTDGTKLLRLKNQHIYVIFPDSKGQIWIGSQNGVYVYSFVTNQLREYALYVDDASSGSKVYCVFEDKQKRIWIGTRSGLGLYMEDTQTFKMITTKDGLPNNNVFGILQDDFGRLWLSTNKGLACYTPENGNTRTYSMIDGLQSDQFNRYAYCKIASGEMFFGGINGITHFYPEQLQDNPFTPPVTITQFSLFNKVVLPDDDTGILSESISETKRITLKPRQSSFSITFTVPNYLSAQQNTFAYKLEGLDRDWNYTTDMRKVNYANLEPGDYTFYVKAANRDGKWNNTPTTLEIKILPYWWNTLVAQLLFILSAGVVLYFTARFFYNRQRLKNQLNLERIEKEKMKEVNQMKLRFFINISHEFRTPLTLIISPLQEILSMTNDRRVHKQVKLIQRNTNRLLYLVNQLMDYRRAELGVFELQVVKQSPLAQVEEMMGMFERLAKQKDIDFIVENEMGAASVIYDPHYFSLILSNLLSNAFKFTSRHEKILIRLALKDNHFILMVSDTGSGIQKELHSKIFERFYQANYDNIGTGIGLSLVKRLIELHHGTITLDSEPEKGATFTVFLPQDKNIYSEKEQQQGEKLQILHPNTDETRGMDLFADDNLTKIPQQDEKPVLLIVEDDADVCNYLIDYFSGVMNIEHACNGEEALDIIRNSPVDMVISDVMMPVMDGIKLCKSIKQNIRTSHIPVILLTAKTNQQDQLEGLSVGADDYVSKPFNISILKMKIQNMLKSRIRMRDHYSNTLEVDPQKITFNEMDKEFLEKAKAIVEENMDKIEFSVDNFCKQIAMSRSNLHLKMKAITGESTIEFIKKIRFNHACNLLKEGRYSVAEISMMVGFNTPSYFTTSFKKYFGVLPTDYLKDIKK